MDSSKRPVKSGGDAHFNTEAYYPGNSNPISWEDLKRSATILTELSHEGKQEIEYYLGYLPHESVTIRFEPFLRSLIHQKNTGVLPYEQYSKLAEEHVRLIRNEDVRYNLMEDYDQALYQTYYREYLPYGALAKQRLIDMLGYAPELKHSLVAELYLRKMLANDLIRLQSEMSPIDYKAITLIRYRQILLFRGKDAADSWPLLNCEPDNEFNS